MKIVLLFVSNRLAMLQNHKRSIALQDIEDAKILYYFNRLNGLKDSKKIWRKLRNLGLCSIGFDSNPKFPTVVLNAYFSAISFDPSAKRVCRIAELKVVMKNNPLSSPFLE